MAVVLSILLSISLIGIPLVVLGVKEWKIQEQNAIAKSQVRLHPKEALKTAGLIRRPADMAALKGLSLSLDKKMDRQPLSKRYSIEAMDSEILALINKKFDDKQIAAHSLLADEAKKGQDLCFASQTEEEALALFTQIAAKSLVRDPIEEENGFRHCANLLHQTILGKPSLLLTQEAKELVALLGYPLELFQITSPSERFVKAIEDLQRLSVDQSLVLMGGGSLLYHFTKCKNNQYDLSVYTAAPNAHLKLSPVLRYRGIPEKQLLHSPQTLVPQLLKATQDSNKEIHRLQTLKPYLIQGDVFAIQVNATAVQQRIDTSGTPLNSWECLKSFLKQTLPKEAYDRLLLATQLRTIEGFYNHKIWKSATPNSEVARTLLKEGCRHQLRLTLKFLEDSGETSDNRDELAKISYATSLEILEKLKKREEEILAHRLSLTKELAVHSLKTDMATTAAAAKKLKGYKAKPAKPAYLSQTGLLFFTKEELQHPEQLSSCLSTLNKFVSKCKDNRAKVHMIDDLVSKLSIPVSKESNAYWSQVKSPEKVAEKLTTLLQAYKSASDSMPPVPQLHNTAWSLLALVHNLAVKQDLALGNTLLNNYPLFYPGIYLDNNPFNVLLDKKQAVRRQEVADYFHFHQARSLHPNSKKKLFDFTNALNISKNHPDGAIKGNMDLHLFDELLKSRPELAEEINTSIKLSGPVVESSSKVKWSAIPSKIRPQLYLYLAFESHKEPVLQKHGLTHLVHLKKATTIASMFLPGKNSSLNISQPFSVSRYGSIKVASTCVGPLNLNPLDTSSSLFLFSQASLLYTTDWNQSGPNLTLKEFGPTLEALDGHREAILMKYGKTAKWQKAFLPGEATKKLMSTHAQPALQPQQVISYFTDQIPNLYHRETQASFEGLFFKTPVVVGEDGHRTYQLPVAAALEDPCFIKQCTSFIRHGVDHYLVHSKKMAHHDRIRGASFFVRLGCHLQRLHPESKELGELLQSLSKITETFVEDSTIKLKDKVLLHYDRIYRYLGTPLETLSKNEMTDIFGSWFFINAYSNQYVLPYVRHDVQAFTLRILEHLGKHPEKRPSNSLLVKKVIHHLPSYNQLPQNEQWKTADYPHLRNGGFAIDLATGRVAGPTIKNSTLLSATSFTGTPLYKYLFGHQTHTYYTSKKNECHFVNPVYHGMIATMIPKKEENPWDSEIKFNQKFRKAACSDQWELFRIADGRRERFVLPNMVESLLPGSLVAGCHHWVAEENDPTDRKVVVTDPQTGKEIAILRKNGSVVIPGKEGASVMVSKLAKEKAESRFFSHFEREKFIDFHYSDEAKSALTKVALKRYSSIHAAAPLEFLARPGGHLVWKGDEQYVLATPGSAFQLTNFTNFLQLVHRADPKKQKILVPIQSFDPETTKPLSTEGFLDVTDKVLSKKQKWEGNPIAQWELSHAGKYRYVEYDVVNGNLKPNSQEGKLFLAFLQTQQKNYRAAAKLLRSINVYEELSPTSQAILANLVYHRGVTQDESYNASAISLHAAHLLARYNERTPAKKRVGKKIIKISDKALDGYLSRENEVDCAIRLNKTELEVLSEASTQSNTSPFANNCPLPERKHTPLLSFSDTCEKVSDEKIEHPILFWSAYRIARKGSVMQREVLSAVLQEKARRLSDLRTTLLCKVLLQICQTPKMTPPFPKYFKPNDPKVNKIWQGWMQAFPHLLEVEKKEADTPPSPRQSASPLALQPATIYQAGIESLYESSFIATKPLKDGSDLADFDPQIDGLLQKSERIYSDALKKEIDSFKEEYLAGKKQLEESAFYKLQGENKIDALVTLSNKLDEMRFTTSKLEGGLAKKLLELANRSISEAKALEHGLKTHGKVAEQIGIERLLYLFIQGDAKLYQEANPTLRQEQIEKLYQVTAEFLQLRIQRQQIKRSLDLTERALSISETMAGNSNKEKEFELIIDQIGAELRKKSLYDITEHPLLALFEAMSDLILRPIQVELLKTLFSKDPKGKYSHSALQLIMGGGKTSVLAALQLAEACKKGRIPLFLTPRMQFEIVKPSLGQSLKKLSISLIPLDYKREDLTVKMLTYIRNTLRKTKTHDPKSRRQVIMMTPDALQTLELEMHSLIFSIQEGSGNFGTPPETVQRITLLQEILKDFRTSCDTIGDEVHLLLNENKEVNFTTGGKTHVSPERIDLVKNIFGVLASKEVMVSTEGEKVSMDQLLDLTNKTRTEIPSKLYHEVIAPKLAEVLAEKYSHLFLSKKKEHWNAFIRYATGRMETKVEEYLNGKIGKKSLTQEQLKEDVPFLLYCRQILCNADSPEEQEAAQLISLTKHLLTTVLPLTLNNFSGKNFGRTFDPAVPGKISPYIAVATPATTEFGYHWETGCYQMMEGLCGGCPEPQVLHFAQNLKQSGYFDAKIRNIAFSDTVYYKYFKKLTGKDLGDLENPNASPEDPSAYDKKVVAEVMKALSKNPSARLEIEAFTAGEHLHYFPNRLVSTSQSLFHQVDTFRASSGTPTNHLCYPIELQKGLILDKGTEGRIVHNMRLKAKGKNLVHTTKTQDPEKILKKILKGHPTKERIAGFQDYSGMFKGKDNLEVASGFMRALKKSGSPLKAVAFFYKPPGYATPDFMAVVTAEHPDDPIILQGSKPSDFEKLNLKPEDYFIYYDERHTQGTDAKQPPKAINIQTKGESGNLPDDLQSAMRLRQYLNPDSQNVEYLVHENARAIFEPVFGGFPPTIDQLLTWEMRNLAIGKARGCLKAYKAMLDDTLYQLGTEKLLECDVTNKAELTTLLEVFSSFIKKSSADDPLAQFGPLDQEIDTIDHLQGYRDKLTKSFQKLAQAALPKKEALAMEGAFKEKSEAILHHANENAFLQSTVMQPYSQGASSGANADFGIQIQQEVEVKQEQQVKVKIQQEQEQQIEQEYSLYTKSVGMLKPASQAKWTVDSANAFLDEIRAAKSIKPLYSAIDPKQKVLQLSKVMKKPWCFPYPKPYHKIFDDNILATSNFLTPYQGKVLPVFHPLHRLFSQVLITQAEDGSYRYVLLSKYEAKLWKQMIESGKVQNAWLTLPDLHSLAKAPVELKETEALLRGMLQVSLLGGDVSFLSKHLKLTKEWLKEPAPLGTQADSSELYKLKRRFAYLAVHKNSAQKAILKNSTLFGSSNLAEAMKQLNIGVLNTQINLNNGPANGLVA